MSVSDNSTLLVARDSYESIDGHYGVGDLPVNFYDKSPYTDTQIISLDVGPTQTRYRVHRAILSQSPELDAKPALKLWGVQTNDTIPLPELDETTAHTLVHYLYTGRYQTLETYSSSLTDKGPIPEYKLSTCVYCAAIRYKISGLAELAKEKITSFGEDLDILDILRIARENAFPLLPEDEAWFPAYIEGAIKAAVADDPLLFKKPGFSDQIEGNRRFKQVMVQAILSYAQGAVTPSATPTALSVPDRMENSHIAVETTGPVVAELVQEEEPITETVSTTIQEPEPVIEVVPDEPVKLDVPVKLGEPVKLDEIEPTLGEPVPETPEPFTDELGSYNSKTYQKMGSKKVEDTAITTEETKSTPPTQTKPVHIRHDSGIQAEQVIPAPLVTEEKATTSGVEMDRTVSSPPIVDGTNGTTTASKKKKKKTKKPGTVF